MNTSSSALPSFAAIRTAHTHLLRLYRDKGASPELLLEAEAFVDKAAATGSLIQSEDDRMGAQSLLDYWAAILSRADRPPTQAFLEEFDAELVPTLPDSLCPYVGLESFGESRRGLFFGRERVLNELATHLQQERFIAVIGPLGSGKSSIVLGGLIPALKGGLIAGSSQWRFYQPLVPGADPLASLARAVGVVRDAKGAPLTPADVIRHIDAAGDTPAVIVVDRFEELFSVCESADKRDEFADAILAIVASPKRHFVIATMRSDFEAQIAAIPQLYEPFKRAQFRLPPLSATELREAICGPAEQVGLKFEEGLVDRLVKETLGEPAGLPLLQFTLLKLWDMRDRNRVTLEAYRKIGGGRLALARTADELYESLSAGDQQTLKTILLLMARPAAGMEVISTSVRRSALYAKADRASVDRVIDKLITTRLVRVIRLDGADNERIEIAHDALLSNWPRLVEWLDEERIATRRRVRLTTAAEQWRAHGKDPGGLLRGSPLEEAKTYRDLTPFEKEFVDASIAASEEAAAEQERARRRELEQAQALTAEQKRRADEQTLAAARLKTKNRLLTALAALAIVLALAAATGWMLAERKKGTVEALMSGQGVVVEEPAPRPQPSVAEPASSSPSPPSPPPPSPSSRPPSVGPPSPPSASNAPPPTARANAKVGNALGGLRSSGGFATVARETQPDPEKIVSQIQLRAARRPTGRQIAGTELPAYAFTIWADGPAEALDQIKSIEYEFNHPTFREKLQTGSDRQTGFRVGYSGWGCLSSVVVTFRLRDESAKPPHVDFNMCGAIVGEAQRK